MGSYWGCNGESQITEGPQATVHSVLFHLLLYCKHFPTSLHFLQNQNFVMTCGPTIMYSNNIFCGYFDYFSLLLIA